jgi:hypothetical protein
MPLPLISVFFVHFDLSSVLEMVTTVCVIVRVFVKIGEKEPTLWEHTEAQWSGWGTVRQAVMSLTERNNGTIK